MYRLVICIFLAVATYATCLAVASYATEVSSEDTVQETAKACSITTGDACPWIEHTTCGTYPLILDLLAGIQVIVLQSIDASFPRL